jgi:transcriptional regulator with XRE-family HTH domain
MSSILCTIGPREIIIDRSRSVAAFGSALDKKMRSRGWEAKDLAAESGIPIANIYRWLSSGRPVPSNVTKIAKAFGEDPAEWMLLAGYHMGDLSDPDEMEKELLTQVRALPWLRSLVPDIAALSSRNQEVVQDLVKSLRRQEGDGSQ